MTKTTIAMYFFIFPIFLVDIIYHGLVLYSELIVLMHSCTILPDTQVKKTGGQVENPQPP